ncbi:MAG TPA: flavodoxin [Candidatus Blautia faecavium]|uniref:Flavodoxin n=1 Tax=Candidatus Blautia faecavium TaxID=2838487 RepID=A0A9D2LQP7_9FIRM|nr:flavodoxin [Candidatus Blautia faecavium]
MKKNIVSLLLALTLSVPTAVYASSDDVSDSQQEETSQEGEAAGENAQSLSSNFLVVYFTYGENADLPEDVDASASASIQTVDDEVTGNTGAVARMISEAAKADLFSIRTVQKYPDNYDDTLDQAQDEQSQDTRPELETELESLDAYQTIFLGFPNWWGDMPMAVYSFLDDYDLSGKTLIPFVTSGGSGFSSTISEIESAEPEADVLEGLSLSSSEASDAEEVVEDWLDGLGYLQ